MWTLPARQSSEYVANMEDVLDVYEKPHDEKSPLYCMDELNKQLVKEVRTPLPPRVGQTEKYDCEYERNGSANVFLAFSPFTGKRLVKVTDRRTKIDWAEFIKELVDSHPEADKIKLVMDNLNTHKVSSLYEAFLPEEARRIRNKLEIHYTPKHGSWLNIAEMELSHLSRQCFEGRRIPDQDTLVKEVGAWKKRRNELGSIVKWQFTTLDARVKLKSLYPVIAGN